MSPLARMLLKLSVVAVTALPALSHAWWNADFKQRTKITLNTSAAGVETKEALSGAVVPVRLHSGNFDFLVAKPDGSDLRVVAGDDKTPLRFSVERFDDVNQLAVLWVQVPIVAPGSDKNEIFVYSGNAKAVAEAPASLFDSATLAVFHFAEKDGAAADASGTLRALAPATVEPNALIGSGVRLGGTLPVAWPASDRLRATGGSPLTYSVWLKSDTAAGTVIAHGPLRLALEAGKATLRVGSLQIAGGNVPVSAWAHIGVVIGNGKAILYVDGQPAAEGELPAPAPAIEGGLEVGNGFSGVIDELQVVAAPRSADWMKFTRAAQGADAKLVASSVQTEGEGEADGGGGDAGYIGILVKNLTVDAWVVIGILGVMFVIAVYVMITKSIFVQRAEVDNRRFVERFRSAGNVLQLGGTGTHANSSLARLYEAGLRELAKRQVGHGGAELSGASMDAVKAAIDADVVRETQRLNSKMVLLTIAISGGPFLGLLGTVVGVMITFAAIAAAGDVNVNAIAPGIAAALLATVAGLGVAIPSLFGYNYLASRIKNISSDMQIFVDEFVTRVAETYGAR